MDFTTDFESKNSVAVAVAPYCGYGQKGKKRGTYKPRSIKVEGQSNLAKFMVKKK